MPYKKERKTSETKRFEAPNKAEKCEKDKKNLNYKSREELSICSIFTSREKIEKICKSMRICVRVCVCVLSRVVFCVKFLSS